VLKTGISWFIDYRDRDGKRIRHRLHNITTQKNAELAFAEFRLKYERGELSLPTDERISLADVLTARIEERQRAGCVSKWVECLNNYKEQLLAHFGRTALLRSLNDKAVANYRLKRLEVGKSAQTVNKELMFLQAAGKLAIEQGKVGKLPWNKVDRAIERHVDEAWGYLKADEIATLLDVLKNGTFKRVKKKNGRFYPMKVKPNLPLWRMVTFLLNTGARRGEMFALKWSDVIMDTRMIRLVSSKSAKNGQSAKARYIPMNAALIELFEGMKPGAPGDIVFKHDINLRRKFLMALRWADLPEYRVHDLRHTFASHLVMNGVPLYTVSKLLGHSSIEVTHRYAHLAPDNLMHAVQSLSFGAPNETKPEPATRGTEGRRARKKQDIPAGHV